MESICIEERTMDKHTREGFRILARIITRDFEDFQSGTTPEENLHEEVLLEVNKNE